MTMLPRAPLHLEEAVRRRTGRGGSRAIRPDTYSTTPPDVDAATIRELALADARADAAVEAYYAAYAAATGVRVGGRTLGPFQRCS